MNDIEPKIIESNLAKLSDAFKELKEKLSQYELPPEFNIFEAIGMVHQEIRHSYLLSYLLDPKQNHGLGDKLAKSLLFQILSDNPSVIKPYILTDLEVWNLSHLIVKREWRNIDILLLDQVHNIAIIIENKVYSSEHDNQLSRYLETITQVYKGWKVLPIYLTPNGILPTHESYLALSYTQVCNALVATLKAATSDTNAEINILLNHYIQMLRRNILSEAEIARLCQEFYWNHQATLDLIFKYRPDYQSRISKLLLEIIVKEPDLILIKKSKKFIHFTVKTWDEINLLRMGGEDWSSSRMLFFQFDNDTTYLNLGLHISPGGAGDVNGKLKNMATANLQFLKCVERTSGWYDIFQHNFLENSSYQMTFDHVEKLIRKNWEDFLEKELLIINKIVGQEHFDKLETNL